jgi:DDE superfamily endonuclease/Helix-turn-helix of DDE superfamily endonuclease
MRYEQVKNLPSHQFKRLLGVRHQIFHLMVWVMRTHTPPQLKSGRPTKLSLEDQILVVLQYWREYRTYFHIGETWGVSEATVRRIVNHVETTLIRSSRFRLPGKKWLLRGHEVPAIVVDVTETPIERPKHSQKQFYSGKKKTHTLKSQLVVDQQSRRIICTAHGKGRRHDFWLLQASGVRLHPGTEGLGDKGYQGWRKLHANSYVPKKKPKGEQLSKQE